ncbi:stage V sporulation protein AA [Mangrovibacillus cuniculi]|uniref:Stage V sporulation protein AA n=1 Tax=Mangrovibacillus cuniculi TaxID=2593652 RepID=A0A7S8CBI1_9BACI|nr:stage V sporulation protein AA [Mangrovibacillus cuniculi]QPC46753.1 stage V sporulation protein AA [Mangrovibacillus cuniculi]
MTDIIYLRLRNRAQVKPNEKVILGHMAQVLAPEEIRNDLLNLPVYQVKEEDKNIVIIDVMKVIQFIQAKHPNLEVQTVGPPQTIIEVVYEKKHMSMPLFVFVWLLLFVGAALAIMNFHEDVSMPEVHQKLYTVLTGQEVAKPLLFQIPYSFGLGLGMILFFNHLFRKRINEEPSPLEVEMFNYQQDLDQYVIMNENKESMRHLDDN